MQWWVGITIGLLAVANFLADRFVLSLLILLITTYFTYTVFVIAEIGSNIAQILALSNYLAQLPEINEASRQQVGFANDPGIFAIPQAISAVGLFIGTIAFLIYSYRRRNATPLSVE
jgi:biopolymer transport protein ExbB/TolQ